MSKLGALRKRVGYETNTPKCETCKAFRKPYIYLTTDSHTKRSQPLCSRHHFTVAPNACCDDWEDANGVILLHHGMR